MKHWCVSLLAAFCSLGLSAGFAFGQNGTLSSKAVAAINTAVACTVSSSTSIGDTLPLNCHDVFGGTSVPTTPDNFVTIMTATVKVSNSESLFVSPSLVTGLYTETKTKTQTNSSSTATAMGGVYERAVLMDSNNNILATAYPVAACADGILGCQAVGDEGYGVVLDSRVQTLTQSLSNCVVTVGTSTGSCTFTSTIDLILNTTSAHTFNFIFPNVGVGVYTVAVQGAVDSSASQTSGTAIGAAAFGLGSVTVDVVRLTNDFSF